MTRRLPFALFALLLLLAVAVADRYGGRVDLTRGGRHSLSTRSKEVLRHLPGRVDASAFYRGEDLKAGNVRDLLLLYEKEGRRFRFTFVDPDRNPNEVARAGVRRYGVIVLEAGDRKETVYNWSENSMTAALVRLFRETPLTVRVTTGHGENDGESSEDGGMSLAWEALHAEAIDTALFTAVGEFALPGGTDLVVMAGPKVPLTPGEVDRFERFIRAGGKMLLLLDPGVSGGVLDLLNRFGMEARRDVVVDRSGRLFGTDATTIVVERYDTHDATRGLRGATVLAGCRSIVPFRRGAGGGEVRSLLTTGDGAWGETGPIGPGGKNIRFDEGKDHPGPLCVGMIASVPVPGSEAKGRLAVIGDSDFATNRYVSEALNGDLFLALVRWMAGGESAGGIRAVEGGEELLLLSATRGKILFWAVVVAVPALWALIGGAVAFRWRRRG